MNDRFWRLTKEQWKAVGVVIGVTLIVLQLFIVVRVIQLAGEGAQAHSAECSMKHSLDAQVEASKKFLALSHRQVVRRYGRAFASIPRATIVQSLNHQESAARALDSLDCR